MKKTKKPNVFISLILRHKPEVIGIQLDKHGYANVEELIQGVNKTGRYTINFQTLSDMVHTDGKKRYGFNEDQTLIRAFQGHSFPVDALLKELPPPDVLFHGTAEKNLPFIQNKGIQKMTRQHVHLSADETTAYSVGKRHGVPVVLRIDTKKMKEDGFLFYLSENKVWLTDFVPSGYIQPDISKKE